MQFKDLMQNTTKEYMTSFLHFRMLHQCQYRFGNRKGCEFNNIMIFLVQVRVVIYIHTSNYIVELLTLLAMLRFRKFKTLKSRTLLASIPRGGRIAISFTYYIPNEI